MSISPEVDSISQSYQPEAFDPKLFEFPDYFFEGFPTSLGMDFKDKLIKCFPDFTQADFPKEYRSFEYFVISSISKSLLVKDLDLG